MHMQGPRSSPASQQAAAAQAVQCHEKRGGDVCFVQLHVANKKKRTVVQRMPEKREREPLFMFACRPGRVRWRERESARQQAATRQQWLVARYCSAVASRFSCLLRCCAGHAMALGAAKSVSFEKKSNNVRFQNSF
jgi:hypothetical protein